MLKFVITKTKYDYKNTIKKISIYLVKKFKNYYKIIASMKKFIRKLTNLSVYINTSTLIMKTVIIKLYVLNPYYIVNRKKNLLIAKLIYIVLI